MTMVSVRVEEVFIKIINKFVVSSPYNGQNCLEFENFQAGFQRLQLIQSLLLCCATMHNFSRLILANQRLYAHRSAYFNFKHV